MRKVDTSGKRAIHLFARAWAEWILEQQNIEVEAELSGEFQFIARTTDVLLLVRGEQEGKFLALIELQLRYDANMPRRLAAYAALAREKYQLEVYVAVIYLTPPTLNKVLADHFYSEFMGQTSQQDFKVIPLWELEANEALALDNPALLPFVPLMRGGDTIETVRTCVERIRRLPEADEMESLLVAFASLVMDVGVLRQLTRWSMQIIKDSPFYRDLFMDLDEARAEARAEGLAEGRETALLILRSFLTFRFGMAEDYFDDRLRWVDLATIQQMTNMVADAESLDTFEMMLAQLVRQAEENKALRQPDTQKLAEA